MSLKENVSYIKEEISTQEQFFENFFKVEKFYKKYKIAIFGLGAVIVGFFIVTTVNTYVSEQNTIQANKAYNKILKTPTDTTSLALLKESNKKLLTIALYQTSTDKTKANDIEFLKEIAMFNKAIEQNDIQALNNLIMNPAFVLKDYALFNKALILSNKKDYASAKESLKMIASGSPVESLALMLKHYLLTK